MAIDAFIRFTSPGNGAIPIKGESQDGSLTAADGWSSVQNVTFGSENPANVSTSTGGSGAGKLNFKEFAIKKHVDNGSAAFFLAICSGGHYDVVELVCRKNTGGSEGKQSNQVFLTYKFKQVKVMTIDVSLSDSDVAPAEDVKFSYAAMFIEYWTQNDKGALQNKTSSQWSQTKNKPDFIS